MLYTKIMKVVLLQDIRGVGRKNDIKDVSDGYAKNFLLVKGLARVATDAAVGEVKALADKEARNLEALKEKLAAIQKEFKSTPLVMKVEVGEHQELFKSVNAAEIKKMLAFRGFNDVAVEPENLHLKALGAHQVKINLGKGVKGTIDIQLKAQK